jgi:hypothetical protein
MSGNENKGGGSPTAFDPALQSEKLGFEPEQMVACESCGRRNPPNRIACLYCANGLSIDPTKVEAIRPGLKRPEIWERGFNLIVRQSEAADSVDISKASQVLSLDERELEDLLGSPVPLPIARYATERDAAAVSDVLSKLGLSTLIVSDEALGRDKPPRRLRSISFHDDSISLLLFNTGEWVSLSASDLLLAVEGVISESRVDQLEKRRLRKGSKVLDGSSTSSIEPVLDLYINDDRTGYRVNPTGFDFSCLADKKSMLSADNLKILTERIVEFCPTVRYLSEYSLLRQKLGKIWDIESRQESTGMRFAGLGRRGFGTVSSTSNLTQFTMFSRLQRELI